MTGRGLRATALAHALDLSLHLCAGKDNDNHSQFCPHVSWISFSHIIDLNSELPQDTPWPTHIRPDAALSAELKIAAFVLALAVSIVWACAKDHGSTEDPFNQISAKTERKQVTS